MQYANPIINHLFADLGLIEFTATGVDSKPPKNITQPKYLLNFICDVVASEREVSL